MTVPLQSALDPGGPKAAAILHLGWFLLITAIVAYVLVTGALLYALRRATHRPAAFDDSDFDEPNRERGRVRWVAAAVAATGLLLLLFIFVDVTTARSLGSPAVGEPLRIDVVGHQWWWEVKYPDSANPQNIVETANEIHV